MLAEGPPSASRALWNGPAFPCEGLVRLSLLSNGSPKGLHRGNMGGVREGKLIPFKEK